MNTSPPQRLRHRAITKDLTTGSPQFKRPAKTTYPNYRLDPMIMDQTAPNPSHLPH